MIFPVLLLLSIIVVIILIVLFFVRTYDTIDNVQKASVNELKHQRGVQNQMENKFDSLTKRNDDKIHEVKEDTQLRLRKIKDDLDKVDLEISQTIERVKEENDKIRRNIEDVDENTRLMNKELKINQQHIEVDVEDMEENIDLLETVSSEAEMKRNELMNTLQELETEMASELQLLEGKHDEAQTRFKTHEDLLDEHSLQLQTLQDDTNTEIEPIKESIAAMKNQIDTAKLKIAHYTLGYDQISRNLNLTYYDETNPEAKGVLSVNQLDANKAVVSDYAIINNASVKGTTTFQRESDTDTYELLRGNGGLNVRMPREGAVRFNAFGSDESTDVQHSFSSDGTAEHRTVVASTVETPSVDFGRYSITEEDGDLILHDSDLNVKKILS